MGEKSLVIKAKGGLGNRILAAVTGLVYADLSGRQPVIDWRDGTYAETGENAYPLLFQAPVPQRPERFDTEADVTPASWAGRIDQDPARLIHVEQHRRHSSPTVYRQYCVDLNRIDQPQQVAVFMSYLPKMPRLARHMRRDSRFRGQSTAAIMARYLAQWFVPNTRVQTALDSLFADLPRPLIGVHVRYTDLKVPLDGIARRLEQRMAKTANAAIFLATDSAYVEEWLRARFGTVHVTQKFLPEDGNHLHQHGKKPGTELYNKVIEAENALIDMWGLGRCDQLIFSRRSTFAITASLVGNMAPAQLDDIDRWTPKVVAKRLLQNYL